MSTSLGDPQQKIPLALCPTYPKIKIPWYVAVMLLIATPYPHTHPSKIQITTMKYNRIMYLDRGPQHHRLLINFSFYHFRPIVQIHT